MSGQTDKYWVFNSIEYMKERGLTSWITSGGPCSEEIINELRDKGYKVTEFSDFEIIDWGDQMNGYEN